MNVNELKMLADRKIEEIEDDIFVLIDKEDELRRYIDEETDRCMEAFIDGALKGLMNNITPDPFGYEDSQTIKEAREELREIRLRHEDLVIERRRLIALKKVFGIEHKEKALHPQFQWEVND